MANHILDGFKVAILVEDGFEESELSQPRQALQEAGATTQVVSPKTHSVRGWKSGQWSQEISVDQTLDQARTDGFDALLLPGGVINPDRLRMQPQAIQFVREFFESGKPVAAICHGLWSVIEAGAAHGRRLTSWPSLKTDLQNAGAEWVNEEVVVNKNLVSSRMPSDLPAFNREMVTLFSEMHKLIQKTA